MGRTLDEIIKTLPMSRRARIESRYRALKRGLKRIVSDPAIKAGESVFEGTRIPLAHIAGIIAPRNRGRLSGAQPRGHPFRSDPIQEEAQASASP
jgi:hypothetical protein